MPEDKVRTTLSLPAPLVLALDAAVRAGRARSRPELISVALRRELALLERAAIDEAFTGMAEDAERAAEVETINAEFAQADWEAFRLGERRYAGRDDAAR